MNRPADVPQAVLERARRGDDEAFAALIRHYDPGLRALAYRLLGNRDRMDDALQETYVKAFRSLPRFRGDSTLGTWLYRIAYRTCLDQLELTNNVQQLPLAHAVETRDPRPDVDDEIAARWQLAEALAELAPPDRAAVLLVDAHGFDYDSAGEVLDVPAGTVASRLNRARNALRRALRSQTEGTARQ